MSQQVFMQVLQKLPLPVTVITVGRGGVENGLTVSWVCPVSFDPPQVMFAVERLHYSVELLRSTRNFVVNVLRDGQQRLVGLFASQAMTQGDKLDSVPARPSETGAAILTDALSYLDCEVVAIHEAGDHLVVVGAVVDAAVLNDGAPLTTMAGLRYQRTAPRR